MNIRWPRIQLRGVIAMLMLGVLFTLLGGSALAAALDVPSSLMHVQFASTALALILCLPIVQTVVVNAPWPAARPWRFVSLHLVGCTLYALLGTSLTRLVSAVTFPLFDRPFTSLAFMPQLVAELPNLFTIYATAAALWSALHASAARREAALQAGSLAARVAQARVAALRQRLHPELLLLALDELKLTIQSDLPRTEKLMQRLANQLRASLGAEGESEPVGAAKALTAGETGPLPSLSQGARWPCFRVRTALLLLPCLLLLSFGQSRALELGAFSERQALFVYLAAGNLALWLVIPIAATATLRGRGVSRRRFVCTHLTGLLLFGVVHVGLSRGLRGAVCNLTDIAMPQVTFAWELQLDLAQEMGLYLGLCALWSAFYAWQERGVYALRASELTARLSEAQLELLMAHLEPHFLYNALNTVSSLMYEDVERTARLLDSLKQLLAAAVAQGSAVWNFAQEADVTRRFVELIEARFGDRISVSWQLATSLEHAAVPRFALRVLVENAVKHNQSQRGALHIHVEGERRDAQLVIAVSDNGRGFGETESQHSGGLRRLDEILRLLYGDGARLVRLRGREGGARVELSLPLVGS